MNTEKLVKGKVQKREGYISWDEYFMGLALLSAKRYQKYPSTQVGACIVNQENKVVGLGYNGLPRGCSDDDFPWDRMGEFLETKYAYVVHAEANAILNAISDLKNCRIYVALMPCNDCSKQIIQTGITEVVYMSDKHATLANFKAGKILLEKAGIKLRQYIPDDKELTINFDVEKI